MKLILKNLCSEAIQDAEGSYGKVVANRSAHRPTTRADSTSTHPDPFAHAVEQELCRAVLLPFSECQIEGILK